MLERFFKNPPTIRQAMRLYGTKELSGDENNPLIIRWAKEIGGWIGGWYLQDSTPWCGLFVGLVVKRAGFPHDQTMLTAQKWRNYGAPVKEPMLGDVLVFKRKGGGHVGFYYGEDHECYHVLGGNQSDAVNIKRIKKTRLMAARRPLYKRVPKSVRRVFLSTKENNYVQGLS